MLCGLHSWNVDRFLLLQGGEAVGFGASSGHTVGDFGSPGVAHKLASGTHWPREGPKVEVWASWYDPGGGPLQAHVNIDGQCMPMQLARGVVDHGAYTLVLDGLAPGCHRYYFQFVDSMGDLVTYPTAGSLGIGPEDGCLDFSDERPAECGCLPKCDAATCGDDGCGGECGECPPGKSCFEGSCCQPSCEPDQCGPDGCGGECLDCGEGYYCNFDFCEELDPDSSGSGDPTTGDPTTSDPNSGGPITDTCVDSGGSGPTSTGTSAGGSDGVDKTPVGCGCRSSDNTAWWALALLILPHRRWRARRSRGPQMMSVKGLPA